MAAVAEAAQPAQFLPDLAGKLVWRLDGVNARGPLGKWPASERRIFIQGSEFESLLEGLHRALERFRRYASGWLPGQFVGWGVGLAYKKALETVERFEGFLC